MSLFFSSSETKNRAQPEPRRYDQSELVGKGLQRLSFQVESRYVTRRFKNHLKHVGIFLPNYGPQRRVPVFIEKTQRRYSPACSNRAFKRSWIRTHKSIKGLKEVPRPLVRAEPVHVGTIDRVRGKFFPNPLLGKRSKPRGGPLRWACRLLRQRLPKVTGENQKQQDELGGNGPSQRPANPAGPATQGSLGVRRVALMSRGHLGLPGGQTFPFPRDLSTLWPNGTIRYFRLDGDHPVYLGDDYRKVSDSLVRSD